MGWENRSAVAEGFLKIPRFQLVKKWRQNKDSVSDVFDFMLKT